MKHCKQVWKYESKNGAVFRFYWSKQLKVHEWTLNYPSLKITVEEIKLLKKAAKDVVKRFDEEAWKDIPKYEKKIKSQQ